MSILNLKLLFAPVDTPGVGAIEDKALDKETVIEMLGEENEEPETIELEEANKKAPKAKDDGDKGAKKEGKDPTEETGDDKEEKELSLEDELEEELEEPDENKLELAEVPRRKEILAAYPDIFKKFPGIEKAIYREQAYAELLPTIEDAKSAVEKAEILAKYEKDIYSGSTESLLSTIKDNDKEAFSRVVDNYLPNLFKVDQQAYYHTISNITKHTIMSMVRDAKNDNNEDLANAAEVLNMYMFGTKNFSAPQRLSQEEVKTDEVKKKEEETTAKERAFAEKQYNIAHSNLATKIDNILKSTVDKHIDPNEHMTDYVKGVATQKVLDGLDKAIQTDTRFKQIYDKLWEKAFDSDFSQESMDRIKAAYVSKAKTLLPILIKKERNEALKGLRRNTSDTKERDKRGPLPVGKTRSSATLTSGKSNSNSGGGKSVPKGMSTLDYLNSED